MLSRILTCCYYLYLELPFSCYIVVYALLIALGNITISCHSTVPISCGKLVVP